jgi:predicted NAD/FAD-binding protein
LKIAVIGAGIAGMAAAHRLQAHAQVTLFEARNRLGGHADTHSILAGERAYPVDAGFSAFSGPASPAFTAWLAALGVATRPAAVSLGVSNLRSGVEYGSRSLSALLCRPRNLMAPSFLTLLRDLHRFHRRPLQIDRDDCRTLAQCLEEHGYGRAFQQEYLLPMCAILWSVPVAVVRGFAAAQVLGARALHDIPAPAGHSPWQVVQGGAASYVRAFSAAFSGTIRLADPVLGLSRRPGQVVVTTASGRQAFDAVVVACPADRALALLEDPSPQEREVLGAFTFHTSRVVVHSDTGVMPGHPRAWSTWNVRLASDDAEACQITHWMNALQSLADGQQFFVTLNPQARLQQTWSEQAYAGPVFDAAACQAQRRRPEINGAANTWYCGAYWGHGFHEDGVTSGFDVAAAIGRSTRRAA